MLEREVVTSSRTTRPSGTNHSLSETLTSHLGDGRPRRDSDNTNTTAMSTTKISTAHSNDDHHYAIDAARLVDKCRSLLHSILDFAETRDSASRFQFRRRSFQLETLADALKCVDRLVHTHLLDLLDREMEYLSSINEDDVQRRERLRQFFGEHGTGEFPTLMDTVRTLKAAGGVAREYRIKDDRSRCSAGMGVGVSHKRMYSTPPSILSEVPLLGVDEPVEVEDYYAQGWYYSGGGAKGKSASSNKHFPSLDDPVEVEDYAQAWHSGGGRRTPSPPPPPPPPSSNLHQQSAGDSSPPSAHAHRRALSTGGIGIPALSSPSNGGVGGRNTYAPTRSAKDSSLFRLIVTLQLCLVRIEEANSVLCGGRARAAVRCAGGRSRSASFQASDSFDIDLRQFRSGSFDEIGRSCSEDNEQAHPPTVEVEESESWKRPSALLALAGIAAGGATIVLSSRSKRSSREQVQIAKVAGKAVVGVSAASFVRKRWRILTMNARVANSADAIEEWIFGWICLGNSDSGYKQLLAPRKSIFWYSGGSIRFQLMKRGMDLLYASIGKAIEITRGKNAAGASTTEHKSSESGLWTYVVASLAASYYNVIGPAAKSASSLKSAPSSVIQNAWGMVSLPAVKKASLEATRILKGAAIADRVEICGVSCFVLSQEPFPALKSALRRFWRKQEREDVRLGTIHETASSGASSVNVNSGFQKKSVILHLTGGGFFAHNIATDLPYLLDWSAMTKAVVVIPEYALFPHKFPDAITEVLQIYRALRCGQAATLLGFQPDRIVVSGESVGGNLAAALCVSMISNYNEESCVEFTPNQVANIVGGRGSETSFDRKGEGSKQFSSEGRYMGMPLPDALMLCCPALNLSLDPTPSRIDGANDPVLPTELITTISNSYIGEYSVTDPVTSPYFALDSTLRDFPPILIFTSSEDPFLDDSVAFNGRLRSAGIKSRLHAVHDLPHAFWGLSTAGIPEARHVQKECIKWLVNAFS